MTAVPDKGEMLAWVLHKPGDLRMERVPIPPLGPSDVLIKVKAVGVCGSDIHYYKSGRIGSFVVESPLILGHECAGQIEEVGPEVRHLVQGERVAVEPGVPCGRCSLCRSGRYNLCRDVRFLATPPVDGAFCEWIVSPSDLVFKLPEELSYEDGALLEPLSVGIHAARRGEVGPGSSVLISGSGPIGLAALAASSAFGATDRIVTDLQEHRLQLARRLGATSTVLAASEDVLETVRRLTSGRGAQVAIECSGSPRALGDCLRALGPGGRAVVVGLGSDIAEIPVAEVVAKELDVVGIFRYANTYRTGIELMRDAKVSLRDLVTHRFPMDRVPEAIAAAMDPNSASIKVIVGERAHA